MIATLLHLILIAGQVTLPAGAELVVRLEQSISSERAQAGDAVRLTVVSALKIGTCTVIEQDSTVEGRVVVARRKTRFGRNGLLDITADRVQAADGSWIRLRHARVETADPATTEFSKTRTAAGLIWYAPAAPVIRMFAKGKEVWIPRSARFKVYSDEQRDVQVPCQSPLPKIFPILWTLPEPSSNQLGFSNKQHQVLMSRM